MSFLKDLINIFPSNKTFFIWWLLTCVVLLLPLGMTNIGMLTPFYEIDKTGISFLIIGIYIYNSFSCGKIFWNLDISNISDYDLLSKMLYKIKRGWFYSDVVLSVGMLGTVIGFIMMLSGLSGLDPSDIDSAQNVIKDLGTGMATALWTTLFGLMSSVLLKIQFFKAEKMVNERIL